MIPRIRYPDIDGKKIAVDVRDAATTTVTGASAKVPTGGNDAGTPQV